MKTVPWNLWGQEAHRAAWIGLFTEKPVWTWSHLTLSEELQKVILKLHVWREFAVTQESPKSLQMVSAAMTLKGAYSLEGKLWPT